MSSTCADALASSDASYTDLSTLSHREPLRLAPDCQELTAEKQNVGNTCFSVAKNPFLYPRDLLGQGFATASSAAPCGVHLPDLNGGDVGHGELPCWWLAHAKPRQEKRLAEHLAAKTIPHYLPVEERRALTRGRTRTSIVPSFSGYLFMHCDRAQRVQALESNRLVAVHRISDGEGLRQRLWELADLIEKGAQLTVEALLTPGRNCRVRAGIFKGKEGTVIKRGGKTRLFVFIHDILGGVSMEIEDYLLAPT